MNFPRKVYAIRHNVTNRVYIGSSANVDRRLKAHINALRRHAHIVEDMQEDFDKYGEDYTFTILDEVFEYDDKAKEYEWMKKYQSHIRSIGYNYNDRKWLGLDKEDEESIVVKNKPSCISRTENENELISIIESHKDPAQALMVATCIITGFLAGTGKFDPAYYVGKT